MNLFFGCHRYYRPVLLNTPNTASKQTTLKTLNDENRYFILRKGSASYALSNIILDQDKLTMTASLKHVPAEHQVYLNAKKTKYTYARLKHQQVVLTEVHLYTRDTSGVDTTGATSIDLADIQKIEVIEFDKRRTTNSYVWGSIGAVLGAGLVVALIAAALYEPPPPEPVEVSSCPYISAFDGKGYALQGEIYSAAIYPSLQKEDYLPLQINPVSGSYLIRISNELKEVQHTDIANLVVVEHDKNLRVLMDPDGKPYAIDKPRPVVSALLNNKTDVSKELLNKDNSSCLFKDIHSTGNSQDLYLTFKKDPGRTAGKLILNARSSSWMNYLYTEFSKGFGSYYTQWVREQEKKPASELEKWADEQHIPMSISIKTSEGWKEIKKIKTIGPVLHRELVVPLNLPVGEVVELRISTGFMFWELDYAAMDLSEEVTLGITEIKPYEAIDEDGVDVLPGILHADKKYIVQPDIGDFTILKYKSPDVKPGKMHTVFLHSSGYYTPIREYQGSPKTAFLKSFRKAGAFSAFSKQKFAEMMDHFATVKN